MIKDSSYELFRDGSIDEILLFLDTELKKRNESAFWVERVVPFSRAILSILIPLRDMGILFNPEGEYENILTPELFFRWSDFVCLKTLAFTIEKSNKEKKLLRTRLDASLCNRYEHVDLKELGDYLAKNRVNLDNEFLDFPIASYNLHLGVSNVIKSLL